MGKKIRRSKKNPEQTAEIKATADMLDAEMRLPRKIESLASRKIAVAVFLFLVSFSVFIPSYHDGVVWDDITYIETAAPILNMSHLTLDKFFPKHGEDKNEYKYFRPVFHASLIIDNTVWKGAPRGFHLTNIILHSIATVLLYFLALLLLKELHVSWRHSIALLSSFFFAVYPLHVESVSFVAARGDILASIFFFSCFIFYILSYSRILYLIPAAICFYISFLSKEIAFSFPILLVSFDFISGRYKNRVNIFKYLIFGLLVVFYIYSRSSSFLNLESMFNTQYFKDSDTIGRIFESAGIFFHAYLFYYLKLIFPYDLNPFVESIPFSTMLTLLLSIVLTTGLCAAFIFSIRRKENITAFSILWVLATLGPAVLIAIFPMALTRLADRFLYVPSAGYCILLAYLILLVSYRIKVKWAGLAFSFLLSVSFIITTVKAQEIWTDNAGFWEFTVKKNPSAVAPRINFGDALFRHKRYDDAIPHYKKILSPEAGANLQTRTKAAQSLGIINIRKGNYKEAQKWFKAAYDINDRYASKYYYYMGLISLRKNDPDNAEKHLLQSIKQGKSNTKALYLLGALYATKAGIENSPEHYRLGEEYLKKALALNNYFPKAHLQLSNVYLKTGKTDQALLHAEKAYQQSTSPEAKKQAKTIIDFIDSN